MPANDLRIELPMNDMISGLLKNRLAWLVAAIVVGAGSWYLFLSGGGTGKVSYETQAVERGDVETSVASSGAVSPLLTITVGSEVSGKLTDVLVDFNAKVSKGQKLAQIDPSTFKSKLQSAEADLVVQQATVGSRQVDVSTAQVNLDQAQRDLDRSRQLFEKGLISQNETEKTRNTFEQTQNAIKIAQANLNNARSQIVKVKANLEQAKIDLGRTEIISPVDGVVISRKVDAGQTVAASMQAPELFQIARDLSQIQIETKVDEADIGSIKEGARATFTVDAYPDRNFEGKVAQVRINGTTSQNVVTYSVMVQAANPGQILLPGMTANVKILTAERSNVLRLASAALRFKPAAAAGTALPEATATGSAGQGGGQRAGAGGFPGGGPGGGFQGAGGGNAGATRTGRGRAMVQMTPEVMTDLGLSVEQQTKVAEAMKEIMQRQAQSSQSSSSSNPLGGTPNFGRMFGNNNDAQLMRQRMQNALANVLTEEQMLKYQALGSSSAVRASSVYVLDARGVPAKKDIRIGLQADSQTEVVSGLAEGDKVIVRAKTEQKS
jgi:HlyD family secretion protein